MDDLENQLLHHWQLSKFKFASSSSVNTKADDLRTRLAHLSFADRSQKQNSLVKTCIKDLLDEYSSLMDDNEEGLNNYSDQILKVVENKKLAMESDKWVSGLTAENVCKLGVVQELINSSAKKKTKNVTWKHDLENSRAQTPRFGREKSPTRQDTKSRVSFSKTSLPTEKKFESYTGKRQQNNLKQFSKRVKASYNDGDLSSDTSDVDQQASSSFCTAREQLIIDNLNRNKAGGQTVSVHSYGSSKKSLGARRNVGNKFIPPILNRENDGNSASSSASVTTLQVEGPLKNLDPKMIEMIENEIMDHSSPVSWDDIAGLEFAKAEIKEVIIWPMLRPDLFTGLRSVPKGILLFGPPGTGKTMIGKCIASQSKAVFFSISASSLTSKWVGEGEKMVKCLFAVARSRQPAVIFIDEIDSLLTQRTDGEHESSRRIKTEFLIQLDGAATSLDERVLVIGATNRPQELDEAARRRLVKRLFIPLPDLNARKDLILRLLSKHHHSLTTEQAHDISVKTEGYSGADMANLCRAAALGPIRCIDINMIQKIKPNEVRPINYDDFIDALRRVKTSVSDQDMKEYIDWNYKYGSEA